MRTQACGLAAILILGLGLGGCAASAGSMAGNVVGGAAWGAMKGCKLAWKGGSFAARTAGRTLVGAARGVHEEFSGPSASGDPASQAGGPAAVASAQTEAASLAY